MESVRENQGVLTICVQDKQTENLSEINLKSWVTDTSKLLCNYF